MRTQDKRKGEHDPNDQLCSKWDGKPNRFKNSCICVPDTLFCDGIEIDIESTDDSAIIVSRTTWEGEQHNYSL